MTQFIVRHTVVAIVLLILVLIGVEFLGIKMAQEFGKLGMYGSGVGLALLITFVIQESHFLHQRYQK